MSSLRDLFNQIAYLVGQLDWLTAVDLLFVTVTFHVVLVALRRSRAATLLRGGFVLVAVLFLFTVLLPLPTFVAILRGFLVLVLIATPIIFQPELRRALEHLGRIVGFTSLERQTLAAKVIQPIIRAVDNMTNNHIGALMVLEGEERLDHIIETGVPVRSVLTTELLETIFFPNNPLHDGAVIIRDDRVMAAACVLPLAERFLVAGRRRGTRHRAALGITEVSDALAIVVSEETGAVGVARFGEFAPNLDEASLRDHLFRFYTPERDRPRGWAHVFSLLRRTLAPPRQLDRQWGTTQLGILVISAMLAVAAWLIVTFQFNPPQEVRYTNVPLLVEGIPPNMLLVTPLPETVSVTVQGPVNVLRLQDAGQLRAVVDVADGQTGQYAVHVRGLQRELRVVNVQPSTVEVALEPKAQRRVPVRVELVGTDTLPLTVEIGDEPTATPPNVLVSGPVSNVERVAAAVARVNLEAARTSFRGEFPVILVDGDGRPVDGLMVEPPRVEVLVSIRPQLNTRELNIFVPLVGEPAEGYWVSQVSVQPSKVTVRGSPTVLETLGGFINTQPVDISGASDTLTRNVPLDLPFGLVALSPEGRPVGVVEVTVLVEPRRVTRSIRRPVELINAVPETSVAPPEVAVLLTGPQPILDAIAEDPSLVRVLLQPPREPGTYRDKLEVIVPNFVQAEVIPKEVVVVVPNTTATPTPSPTVLPRIVPRR
ncbi:MAG: diadenylate cyclase CdaA [Ardenticatenia bacterium]|nr:diadenylate cyclase CdaA [Ardenticatenia bacterium]